MDALASEIIGQPWEILYTDGLMLVAESRAIIEEDVGVERTIRGRRDAFKRKEDQGYVVRKNTVGRQTRVRNSPVMCEKGVGSNSIQCISCNGWVHKHCTSVKSHLRTVVIFFDIEYGWEETRTTELIKILEWI